MNFIGQHISDAGPACFKIDEKGDEIAICVLLFFPLRLHVLLGVKVMIEDGGIDSIKIKLIFIFLIFDELILETIDTTYFWWR